MDKIIGSTAAASSLQVTEKAPHLDEASKEILANKEFLAIILKYTVSEYADMSFQEIADCIEGESICKTTEVAPGRTNSNRIAGVNAEFSVLEEMMSRFDVLFKAVNPKLSNGEVTCYLHIDIESQNDYRPGYPIEKRGIYYLSRMISSQIVAPTADTNYDGLEKVYNIFICRNRVPKEIQNTMSIFELANTWNSQDMMLEKEDHDLMAMVIIRLGNPKEDNVEDIFRILNALFYPREEKSYEILKDYVDFSESLTQEVKNMSGLGESVFWEGVEEGMEQGIEQGIEQGREKEKEELVMSMYQNGIPIKDIAKIAGITAEKINGIINSQEVLV